MRVRADRLPSTRQARVLVDGQPLVLTSHRPAAVTPDAARRGEVLSRTELSERSRRLADSTATPTPLRSSSPARKKLPPGSIEIAWVITA